MVDFLLHATRKDGRGVGEGIQEVTFKGIDVTGYQHQAVTAAASTQGGKPQGRMGL